MKIYPNPVINVLNVVVDSNLAMDYRIYTLSGKLVVDDHLNPNGKIDVQQLAAGMYFITLSNDEESQTLKFMK